MISSCWANFSWYWFDDLWYLSLVLSADIYEKVQGELEAAGMETECLGGGRILHDKAQRTIQVFGYSQVSVVILLFSFFVFILFGFCVWFYISFDCTRSKAAYHYLLL